MGNVPIAEQSAYHGCCGEIDAISKAANAGFKLEISVMATVRAATSKLMDTFSSCANVAKQFGIEIVNK